MLLLLFVRLLRLKLLLEETGEREGAKIGGKFELELKALRVKVEKFGMISLLLF